MFGAQRGEAPADLAQRISEAQDGYVNGAAFETAFCDDAFEVSQGSGNTKDAPALSALGAFEEDFTVFDAVAAYDSFEDLLLNPLQRAVKDEGGTPWPTPYSPPNLMLAPGQEVQSKDLGLMGTHSWERQANQMRGLSLLSGLNGGWDDDIAFDRPTTGSLEGLGALALAQPQNPKVQAYRQVVVAAATAGGAAASKIAQELIQKSKEIAALTDDRAQAVTEAREGFRRNLAEVEQLDKRTELLAKQVLDENGDPKPGTTLLDVERLKKLRARALALGRRAIRYQKVNALSTGLAENGVAQTAILQMLAAAVLAGNIGTAAALGAMYDELGKKSTEIRDIRKSQVSKWSKKSELEGFESYVSRDPYEAHLNGLELADLAFFADLEGRFLRKLKRGLKKVGKAVGRTVKKGARAVKGAARSTASVTKRIARTALVTPLKATVGAARNLAHGNVKGALKSVSRSVKSTAKDIANVAGRTLLSWPCKLSSSKLGRAAIQAGAQAVGTAYGGTTGGAVGKEAGRQAAIMNKSMCKGMEQIGVTKGTFRPGRVKGAFKQVAKKLYHTSLSPQAALRAGTHILRDAATGGALPAGSSSLLNKFGTDTLKRLGAGKLIGNVTRRITSGVTSKVGRALVDEAQRQGQRYVRAQVQRGVSKVLPRGVQQYASAAQQLIQNPSGFIQQLPQQAAQYAQQLPQYAMQQAQQYAQQLPQQLVGQAQQYAAQIPQYAMQQAQQYAAQIPQYAQAQAQQYAQQAYAQAQRQAAPFIPPHIPQQFVQNPGGLVRKFIPPGMPSGGFI